MFAIVRAFVGLILMKNTHAPVSCISFVSVINTLGFVLMLVACAPPGPSLTCSTVIKIVKKKLVYFVMLRLNIHYKPNLFGKVHSFPIIDQWEPAVWFTWSLLHCSKLWLEETIMMMMMMIKNITLLRSLLWCRCEHNHMITRMTMSHTYYVVHQNINPHQCKKMLQMTWKFCKWYWSPSQIKVWRATKGVSFNKTRKKIKDSIDWPISKLK